MIEYHTVCIRPVMPPRPAPRVLTPALSMAEEARLIRARTHRAWGFSATKNPGAKSNEARMLAARCRHDEMANRIADLLGQGTPMTAPEIQAHFAVSDNHTRVVLTEMHKAGRITKSKGARNITHWRLADKTEGIA